MLARAYTGCLVAISIITYHEQAVITAMPRAVARSRFSSSEYVERHTTLLCGLLPQRTHCGTTTPCPFSVEW